MFVVLKVLLWIFVLERRFGIKVRLFWIRGFLIVDFCIRNLLFFRIECESLEFSF